MLRLISPELLDERAQNERFLPLYDAALAALDAARARAGHVVAPPLSRRARADCLLLGRVRAPSVAADLCRRARRAGRRPLQGSERPRRPAHRRRLHVSAGLLPPDRLAGRLAAGGLRAPELGRRAGRAGHRRRRPAVRHRRAARQSHRARVGLAGAARAASACSCSTPTSKRTRRGIASSRLDSTAAIAKRASSRRSSSASAASACSRPWASSPRPGTSTRATPRSSSCSAFAIGSRRLVLRVGARGRPQDDDLHDAHAGARRPRRVPVQPGRDPSGGGVGHARLLPRRVPRARPLRQRQRSALQHDRARAANRQLRQRRQPAARPGDSRHVGAHLAGRGERAPSGARHHQRHPRPDLALDRNGGALRRIPARRTGATAQDDPALWERGRQHPRRTDLGDTAGAAHLSLRLPPRARPPAVEGRARHRGARRRCRHAARSRAR